MADGAGESTTERLWMWCGDKTVCWQDLRGEHERQHRDRVWDGVLFPEPGAGDQGGWSVVKNDLLHDRGWQRGSHRKYLEIPRFTRMRMIRTKIWLLH